MADKPYLAIDGVATQHLEIHVPSVGPWFCDANMTGDFLTSTEPKTITIGDTFKAVGTVDSNRDGSFAGDKRTRVIAGAGKWGSMVSALPYRNDAGVRAELVARDVASAVGEKLGSFAGGQQVLGVKYVRNAGTASAILEDCARGVPWYVDFAGVTQVGARVAPTTKPGSIQILDVDERLNRAELIVDDLTQFGIGTLLQDERLTGESAYVGSYSVIVTPESARVIAWFGTLAQTSLVDVLRAIVTRATDAKLFGKYRYRVVTLEVDRVNIQAVSKADGLPDLLSVSMTPGVAGIHAKLALGATVFVEFIAGDRSDPEITGFGGKDTSHFVPQGLVIGAQNESDASLAARQGDGCEMIMPPMVFTGTMLVNGSPTPFTAVGQATTGKLLGVVTGGSAHGVKIG